MSRFDAPITVISKVEFFGNPDFPVLEISATVSAPYLNPMHLTYQVGWPTTDDFGTNRVPFCSSIAGSPLCQLLRSNPQGTEFTRLEIPIPPVLNPACQTVTVWERDDAGNRFESSVKGRFRTNGYTDWNGLQVPTIRLTETMQKNVNTRRTLEVELGGGINGNCFGFEDALGVEGIDKGLDIEVSQLGENHMLATIATVKNGATTAPFANIAIVGDGFKEHEESGISFQVNGGSYTVRAPTPGKSCSYARGLFHPEIQVSLMGGEYTGVFGLEPPFHETVQFVGCL